MNYLLLTGVNHGKLINFAPDRLEHEFVNTRLTYADRRDFAVDDTGWRDTEGFGEDDKGLIIDMLRDWGTGLDCTLYREAVFHFLCGECNPYKALDVFQNERCVAKQSVPMCGVTTAVYVTTFQHNVSPFVEHLTRLIQTTKIESAQWINVARKTVTFKTLHFSVSDLSV